MAVGAEVKAADLYLAIAFLKQCNLACGYCHPFGESKITHGTNMNRDELRHVLRASHSAGFRTYRFTGGECTVLPWFPETLEFALQLSDDVRVNVCTNGTRLLEHLDLYARHRGRVSLRVSLDSLQPERRSSGLDKVLTPPLRRALEELSARGVYTRFNVVVTTINEDEVLHIIHFASGLGFDVKLLDLYLQEDYIALADTTPERRYPDPRGYWDENYVDLTTLVPQLTARSTGQRPHYVRDGGWGIPMYAFEIEGITVILKDSTRGAFFSRSRCMSGCRHFSHDCQEGVYTPHVSSNMVLHVNGCQNDAWRWNLRGQPEPAQTRMFGDIVATFFQDLVHQPLPPAHIRGRRSHDVPQQVIPVDALRRR
jgi:pyruvate-formate lyase-activating enzyme